MKTSLRNRIAVVATLVFATLLPACGHAELVYREPAGGQVALKGNRRVAMKRAQEQMTMHCGSAGYRVTREETVVLGTNKSTIAQVGAGPQGFGGQVIQSEKVDKELRLTYVCGTDVPGLAARSSSLR